MCHIIFSLILVGLGNKSPFDQRKIVIFGADFLKKDYFALIFDRTIRNSHSSVSHKGLFFKMKLHILEWPFLVASRRHTCSIILLFNQHLYMPHLSGGLIILAKEKCSPTQILTNSRAKFE